MWFKKNPYQSIQIRFIRVPILRFSEQTMSNYPKRSAFHTIQKIYVSMWLKNKIWKTK
jgi:hypothetical protein